MKDNTPRQQISSIRVRSSMFDPKPQTQNAISHLPWQQTQKRKTELTELMASVGTARLLCSDKQS